MSFDDSFAHAHVFVRQPTGSSDLLLAFVVLFNKRQYPSQKTYVRESTLMSLVNLTRVALLKHGCIIKINHLNTRVFNEPFGCCGVDTGSGRRRTDYVWIRWLCLDVANVIALPPGDRAEPGGPKRTVLDGRKKLGLLDWTTCGLPLNEHAACARGTALHWWSRSHCL